MTNNRVLSLSTAPNPLVNNSGNHFFFFSIIDDLSTPTIVENELKNDTIILYFTLDNIQYYQTDNIPYFKCDCKHVGVKQ